ncbi:hypothetical protein GGS24DRAFT_468819 [Hypoxylon argillaceum]|nr:hypothetical protein GGS24DRAFT_468819 [Hypoxylon argillaceum]
MVADTLRCGGILIPFLLIRCLSLESTAVAATSLNNSGWGSKLRVLPCRHSNLLRYSKQISQLFHVGLVMG